MTNPLAGLFTARQKDAARREQYARGLRLCGGYLAALDDRPASRNARLTRAIGVFAASDSGCHGWYVRTRAEDRAEAEPVAAGEQLAHVALFAEGQENAGDKVLPEAVRLCFGTDTGPRRWQWNFPDGALSRLTAPLAVFAVGYNVFDGQLYRRGRFAESMRVLVERSAFFGLRNHGSIERIRELLPAGLRDRVRYQPCPTTVARHLVPGWTDPVEREDTVLVNCAYDRAGLRFGHDYGDFLARMATALRGLRDRADVRYAAHMPADERFVHDLRREHGLSLPVEQLYDLTSSPLLKEGDSYGSRRGVFCFIADCPPGVLR